MIESPPEALRQFRSVLKKSVLAADPRCPCPLVLCQASGKGLKVTCEQGGVGLRLHLPKKSASGSVCFPASLLAELENAQGEAVRFEQPVPFKGRVSWQDASGPRLLEFDTADPSSLRPRPSEPKVLLEMKPGFLKVLAEAAKTASRDAALRAVSHVLLRGTDGSVIGTDGRQLLIQSGFELPFREDVLIPSLPAFACREFAGTEAVRLGHSPPNVSFEVGDWLLTLGTEPAARYPDVEKAVPAVGGSSDRLKLHPDDATRLLRELPGMPGRDEGGCPVTLDLGSQPPAVRARSNGGETAELRLERSGREGKAARVATDRRYLLRALKLGFREVIASDDRPLLCQDANRRYVWMPLDGSAVVAPTSTGDRRNRPMPPDKGNSNEEHRDAPAGDVIDPLSEAEALRVQLQEALSRTSRLIASLKQHKRQSRAVQAAIGSLKRLRQFGE